MAFANTGSDTQECGIASTSVYYDDQDDVYMHDTTGHPGDHPADVHEYVLRVVGR